jgi:CBS domain-containing protein
MSTRLQRRLRDADDRVLVSSRIVTFTQSLTCGSLRKQAGQNEHDVTEPLLHLSLIIGSPLRDARGDAIGRVIDLTALLHDERAPISGAIARISERNLYVPASELTELAHGGLRLGREHIDTLTQFEPRPGEVRLAKEVLDHWLIDVHERRLVRASEVELMQISGWYEVVGVDTGLRGFVRRLLPRRLARLVRARGFRDWEHLEPLTGDLAERAGRRLRRLHPAELADLVEAAAHEAGEQIIDAVHAEPALEAGVFEELDRHHQLEFLRRRTDSEVAQLLARMEPDAAADLAQTLPGERRWKIVALLPPLLRREIRDLLGYEPKTAGGLMTPQFLCLYADTNREEALQRIARSRLPAHVLTTIYVANQRRRLTGTVTLADLQRAPAKQRLGEIAQPAAVHVTANADLEELARLLSDYNLTILPVVDDQARPIGVVTVDDVLALLLPKQWRRRFDIFGGE